MTGHLNHLIAMEHVRDLQRAADKQRVAAIARSAATKDPAIIRFGRFSGGWQMRRRLRTA